MYQHICGKSLCLFRLLWWCSVYIKYMIYGIYDTSMTGGGSDGDMLIIGLDTGEGQEIRW